VRLRLLSIPAVAVLALAVAGQAQACACCGENGTWYESKSKLQQFQIDELKRVRFGPAHTFVTPEGLPNKTYPVTATLAGKTWTLKLGSGGTLALKLPATATTLAVDLRDGKMGGGGGPLLYTEFRLEGSMTASGPLKGTHYRLVLMGRGNNCLNAQALTAWHLDVSGGGPSYALYGALQIPA
jgi:hypothetical protein